MFSLQDFVIRRNQELPHHRKIVLLFRAHVHLPPAPVYSHLTRFVPFVFRNGQNVLRAVFDQKATQPSLERPSFESMPPAVIEIPCYFCNSKQTERGSIKAYAARYHALEEAVHSSLYD